MSREKQALPVYVIDVQEKTPLNLPGAVMRHLNVADYSLLGYERWVAIERKSLSDLCGTLGTGRPRFVRELRRLLDVPFRGLLIEATWQQMRAALPEHTGMHPNAIEGTLQAWAWRYGLPIWTPGDDYEHNSGFLKRLLDLAHAELIEPHEWREQRRELARLRRPGKQLPAPLPEDY